MYVFRNAVRNIARVKVRNILIGVIIFIVAVSSCVGLSIKNSSDKLIESYKNSSQIEATLSLNRKNMMKNRDKESVSSKDFMQNIEQLDVEDIKKYGESEYVKNYYFTIQTELNSSNINKATVEEENSQMSKGGDRGEKNMPPDMNGGDTKVTGDFKAIGYSDLNAMSEFVDGIYKIVNGDMIDINSSEKECLISEDLANENSLEVGSKIIFVNPNNEEKTFEFIVKGIYSDSSENNEFTMFSNAANQVLMSYNSISNIDESLIFQASSKFILQSEDVIENFSNELKEKGLNEYYEVSTNVDSINKNLEPIEHLSKFATTFLIIVLIIGVVILTVINMINIRERKYEIGVLRSIGMKKHLVILQFVIEIFVVTIIAVMIGTMIGSILTVPVSNGLLKSEIESLNTDQNQINENFGMKDGGFRPDGMEKRGDIREAFGDNTLNYIDKLNVVIDFRTLLQLALISIAITIISSAISMIFISRYTPLKILSNRT